MRNNPFGSMLMGETGKATPYTDAGNLSASLYSINEPSGSLTPQSMASGSGWLVGERSFRLQGCAIGA